MPDHVTSFRDVTIKVVDLAELRSQFVDDSAFVDRLTEILVDAGAMNTCHGIDGRCRGDRVKHSAKRLCLRCRITLDTWIATYPPEGEA